MKKKEYIAPDMVTVELPKMQLMAGSPEGFTNPVNSESTENAGDGLAKGGWDMWTDDEPEEVDY